MVFIRAECPHIYSQGYNQKSTVHTVALPSWCCESMIIPFLKAGLKVYFYPVYFFGGHLVQEPDLTCEVILVMDYFGYASSRDYSSYPGTVIRDLTHSIFSGFHQDADYYFGSLRKWSGFLTGGFCMGRTVTSSEYPRARQGLCSSSPTSHVTEKNVYGREMHR